MEATGDRTHTRLMRLGLLAGAASAGAVALSLLLGGSASHASEEPVPTPEEPVAAVVDAASDQVAAPVPTEPVPIESVPVEPVQAEPAPEPAPAPPAEPAPSAETTATDEQPAPEPAPAPATEAPAAAEPTTTEATTAPAAAPAGDAPPAPDGTGAAAAPESTGASATGAEEPPAAEPESESGTAEEPDGTTGVAAHDATITDTSSAIDRAIESLSHGILALIAGVLDAERGWFDALGAESVRQPLEALLHDALHRAIEDAVDELLHELDASLTPVQEASLETDLEHALEVAVHDALEAPGSAPPEPGSVLAATAGLDAVGLALLAGLGDQLAQAATASPASGHAPAPVPAAASEQRSVDGKDKGSLLRQLPPRAPAPAPAPGWQAGSSGQAGAGAGNQLTTIEHHELAAPAAAGAGEDALSRIPESIPLDTIAHPN